VADHLEVLDAAITAVPPAWRRRLMVTCDGAGASHGLIERLDALAARPGHQLTYSAGWDLGERERAAIGRVPETAWQIAIDAGGEVRERRAGDACPDACCGHGRCWIEEAHVTELTALLRQGRAGDQLAGWPAAMRVFARRERPHPGARLTLFETRDGWRYSLWVTNLPERTPGWRGQPGYIDAAHRVHARVEDCIRTGKDTGIGKFPSQAFALNQAWLAAALIAATLLAWLRLTALDGPWPGPSPRPCATASCTPPPAWPAAAAVGASDSPPPGPGHRRSSPPGSGSPPCPKPPDQQPDHPSDQRKGSGTRGTPGHPARQPGPSSYPHPKIKIHYQAWRASQARNRPT
jgi:hypothetical protein